jgi:hypothetical protein
MVTGDDVWMNGKWKDTFGYGDYFCARQTKFQKLPFNGWMRNISVESYFRNGSLFLD